MAAIARREQRSTNIWPGFVDALATLLMVIMFLLMVFVLAQFFLGQALSGRDKALNDLNAQVQELAGLLDLEGRANKNLRENLAQLSQELQLSVTLRDDLETTVSGLRQRAADTESQLADMTAQARTTEERLAELGRQNTDLQAAMAEARQTIRVDKETIEAQLGQLAALKSDVQSLRDLRKTLETQVADALRKTQTTETALAEARGTITSHQSTIEQQVRELAGLNRDIASLRALRSELESKITELAGRSETSSKALLAERELSASARAQVALLNQQTAALRAQLAKVSAALDASEKESEDRKVMISALGKRLNAALASKVQELSRFRSEFFGRLRDVLGKRKGVRIVGDRFVMQSEVLFEKGAADIGPAGKAQLDKLATTLLEIALEIPGGIDWVLRVDGHTDSDPIRTARYPSNWELSSARALSVVHHLVSAGLPPNRLMAAGLGEFQPLDKRDDEIGKRRNRRIEFKFTQR